MLRRWLDGLAQGLLLIVVVALIPAAAVTFLEHIRSVWATPVLLGLCAFTLAAVAFVCLDAVRRLPPKRLIPNLKNIEACTRTWLDKFRIGVKNDPTPTAYFRFEATMDSGSKMYVGRSRDEASDYITLRASIGGAQDTKIIEHFSDDERKRLQLRVQLELARLGVGYRGLSIPTTDFYIFKRVPITTSLSEHDFISAMDSMEAAIHIVGIVWGLSIQQNSAALAELKRIAE